MSNDAPLRHETAHEGVFNDVPVSFRCLAAETRLDNPDGTSRAGIFSFSYLAACEDPAARPVLFAWNGGPGSASLWLHMGALGPRRVVVPDALPAGAGPHAVVDNPLCPLDAADLVFVDPPGTGWSRALGETKVEDLWGLDADAELMAGFVRAWLTEHRRWASPRFLLGESYGTTRAVAVAGKLSGRLSGVALNGIALISAVLDFGTVRFDPGNPLPDVCFLPSYALAAFHHGMITPRPESRDALLDEARRFAVGEYLPALVAGSRLAEGARATVARKLARLTGLSPAWLERARLRVEPGRFRKELLRQRGLTVGRFDARYTGADHDAAGERPDADAASYAVESAFVSAVMDHLTRELGLDVPRPYVGFNRDALVKWDWAEPRREDESRWPAHVNVAPTLGRLQRENPGLRVWVANGLFDLATPFGAAEATVAGNGVDAARVRMTYYEAGHMMYLHEPSLAALAADLRAFLRPSGG